MMKKITPIFLITVSILMAQTALATIKHTIGVARDANDDSVRYIEHHQYLADGQHIVRYYDTDNNLLLEKELRYPGLRQHPSLIQLDYVTDTEVKIVRDVNTAIMISVREGKQNRFTFKLTEDTVVDAGFDAYIHDNWSEFSREPTQKVKFAVAGQSRLLDMKISLVGAQGNLTRFVVEPANWLVRLLLPNITLLYDAEGLLVQYEGFSNIKQAKNNSREVVIEFEHFTINDQLKAPPQEWVTAMIRR